MNRYGILGGFLLFVFFCSGKDDRYVFLPTENLAAGVSVAVSLTSAELADFQSSRPNPIKYFFRRKRAENAKAVAMVLAFPFPFGLVGLHRIYLGCAPYVPVVYIASLGGVFGILPLVDFILLATANNLDEYINNQKVLMWVK